MNHVRIHGNPFGEDAAACLLRSFLRFALGSGMRCALSLTAVQPAALRPGQREIPLTDGVRNLTVGTSLSAAEIDLLVRAAGEAVAATAPVVVFAPPAAVADAARLAGLEWPQATTIVTAEAGSSAAEVLERVRAELRWAGTENPLHGLEERELAPWLSLPGVTEHGPIVHVGALEAGDGSDLVLQAWIDHFAVGRHALRLVAGEADDAAVEKVRQRLADQPAGSWEIVRSAFEPGHVRDAAAVVLPWRQSRNWRVLVHALASGRPVCVSRFSATAPVVGRHGVCVPIGGRNLPAEAGQPAHFEPHPRALAAALREALGDGAAAAAIGGRARRHVVETLTNGRPTVPPLPFANVRQSRPTVVLEAPFFETSSSAELSVETAKALLHRGSVDLRLVPSVPFRSDLAAFRRRAPELEPLLCRNPGKVDLWLSSGWPVRATRPDCRMHALRVDWEYGALPFELTPHVTQDADLVVVHSEFVYRMVTAAGRPMPEVKLVPHGVDVAMHELAPADPEITAWKQGRPAVLFCGGMVWRKGFDVFLRTVLGATAQGLDFCVVVKTVGQDQHYGRFHLRDLVQRFRATPGTPPLLMLEHDLSREQLASVYTAADVLLHPYRGEGFGLPVLEARACGLPVLVTGGGAADSLLAGVGAQKILASRRAVELSSAHVSEPWLLDPSAEDATRLLVETLRDLPARKAEARCFAQSVRAAFPWDAAARAIEQFAFASLGRRQLPMPNATPEPVVTLPIAAPAPARAVPTAAEPVRS